MIDELFILELVTCVWVRDRIGLPDEGERVLQHALMLCGKFGPQIVYNGDEVWYVVVGTVGHVVQ